MVSSISMALRITIESGITEKSEFVFNDRFRIGRHSSCQLQIKNQEVSRYHAVVFKEDGEWWIQDLKSANGLYIEGLQIDKYPILGTTRIQLGISGPCLLFDPEMGVRTDPPDVDNVSVSDYKQHYFGDIKNGEIGQHTRMVRQAYAEVQKKQRWMYISVIGVITVLLILTGSYAVYKNREVKQQRDLATDIFYSMKALEIELAKVIKEAENRKTVESQEQIEKFKAEQRKLKQSYNRFVEALKVYRKDLSEEERIILRIARLFGECEINMPKGFVKEVSKYIEKWQSTKRFERAIRKAQIRGYIPKIIHELSTHNLPSQFFYLALQESNFDPDACGVKTKYGIAKGMWQFIPATAAKYRLKTGPFVNDPIPDLNDDRHNFDKSTLAAAKYLSDIYSTDAQASGLLVMASYNWGEDRIVELIRSMPQNPRKRNYWQLISQYRNKIPDETYDYVFSIFAAAVIGENPRLFGFNFDNPLAQRKTPSQS